MRIGLDARMYRSSVAGIGRYSQNLIKNLLEIDHKNQYVLFMTNEDAKEFKNHKLIRQLADKMTNQNVKIVMTEIPHFTLSEQTKLPSILENEHLDLMHFLNFNHPVRYKEKFIVTIHDLTLLFYPETAKKTNYLKRTAFYYVLKKACQNASKVIAVSESTKKDIVKEFKIPGQNIQVIYEAADDKTFLKVGQDELSDLKEKYSLENSEIILCVGQFRSHKNLPGLIEAFDILKRDSRKFKSVKLVILGKQDPKYAQVYKTLDRVGSKNDILMPGFVTDKELACWYKIARVFVFPSFYEGFGLPGLEAMISGVPVVASNKTSLPEVYQQAAIYFDPFNSRDIADKIKLVLQDRSLQQKLINEGSKVAAKYSWRKTAEETLKLYQGLEIQQ